MRKASSETVLLKMVTKAVLERRLIEDGDKILVAVSGGKDSTAMAWALEAVRPALKINYTLVLLHIANEFSPHLAGGPLADFLSQKGLTIEELGISVLGRLKEGEKMNCYWCSTQRRTELLKYAIEHGCNKIALGHHMDDIIETFFMNMMQKGEMSTMPMKLVYQKYPVSLIRPLGYLEEKNIIAFADDKGLLKVTCTCGWNTASARLDFRRRIADFTGGSGDIKRRILASLANGPRDLLFDDRIR